MHAEAHLTGAPAHASDGASSYEQGMKSAKHTRALRGEATTGQRDM